MTYAVATYDDMFQAGSIRLTRKRPFQLLPAIVGLAGSALVASLILDVDPAMGPGALRIGFPHRQLAASMPVPVPDPALTLAFSPAPLGQATPVGREFQPSEPAAPTVVAESTAPAMKVLAIRFAVSLSTCRDRLLL